MASSVPHPDHYPTERPEPGLAARLFTEHPKDVNETYFQHLKTASSFAGGLALCAFCCFVHALVPGFFTNSASARVERMHARMHNRAAPQS